MNSSEEEYERMRREAEEDLKALLLPIRNLPPLYANIYGSKCGSPARRNGRQIPTLHC
jgi:hypothetical protein